MKPVCAITPDRLAGRLHEAVYSCGGSGYRIPLAALATANTMLGAPGEMISPVLGTLARSDTAAPWTRNLWATMTEIFPYLAGHIEALTGWLDKPQDHEAKALTACFGVLAVYDLPKSFDQAGGDLLGPVYMMLRGKRDKQAQGAFYTPHDVSSLIAEILGAGTGGRETEAPGPTADLAARLVGLREHSSVADPCCGAGGMAISAFRMMRVQGLDPDTCTWVLNDIDPIAVALAGVNMAAHGMTRVILTCGNGLLLGTGAEGGPLLSVRETPGSVRRDVA